MGKINLNLMLCLISREFPQSGIPRLQLGAVADQNRVSRPCGRLVNERLLDGDRRVFRLTPIRPCQVI